MGAAIWGVSGATYMEGVGIASSVGRDVAMVSWVLPLLLGHMLLARAIGKPGLMASLVTCYIHCLCVSVSLIWYSV